jgi:chemotaxis protein CheD
MTQTDRPEKPSCLDGELQGNIVKNEVFVDSGEVKVCKGEGVLHAGAIGSCVVVAAYDPDCRVGGMAHVMLPGVSRDRDPAGRTKYAEHAVQEMMQKMVDLGSKEARLYVCLIGGGNLLGDGHDSPGAETVRSLAEILHRMRIEPVVMEVGGIQRRSCTLDVHRGRVSCTIGDSAQRKLWEVEGSIAGSTAECRDRSSSREGKEVGA